MAYIKNTWVDQNVERPRTYELQNNTDGSVTFIDSFGNVTELGTPVNADNMNHIEEGIYAGSFTKYDANGVYEMDDLVTVIEDGSPVIYKSLQNNNEGNTLSDTTYWEKISLGGGGGLEIGDIGFTQMAIDESKGKRRVLNGQLIIQDQYVQFTNIIKESVALNPDLACTEAEWQTAVTMSTNGVCEKFVIDDNAGTIRLPKYPQYLDLTNNTSGTSAKTATVSVLGTGKALGLTTDGGNAGLATASDSRLIPYSTAYNKNVGVASGSTLIAKNQTTIGVIKNASTSGLTGSVTIPAIAGVTSEKIKGQYFIQVATGAETEDNIINEIELNNPFSLLDYKYSEYELNNLAWLRSNGQFNSKAVYPAVYDLLLKIYNGTETKAGVSVKLSTETFTDYDFVLNTADETFRLPIKVKLASGKAVVGNGMALGITDGTTNYGFGASTNAGIVGRANGYGSSVGTSDGSSTIGNTKLLGITTDATKSGLELSGSDLYLYFYVGETVQNANLVNIGRIQETMVTKSMVDGAWVNKYLAICSSVTISDSNVDYDLSDYLPNDGYNYEVIFAGNITTTSTSGAYVNLYIKSSIITSSVGICGTRTRTTSTMTAVGSTMIPIGTNRVVTVGGLSTAGGGTYALSAVGYRRIGTNI